jgi:hypothetical protein
MTHKPRRWRLIGVYALAIAAPIMLVSTSAHATTEHGTGTAPAQFSVPRGTVYAGQAALFKAVSPSGATGLSWTLAGPGVIGRHLSATCSPDTSRMESSFDRAGVMHITLNVSYASGAVSSVTHKLTIRAAKVRPIASAMAKQATGWVMCLRGPTDPAVQPTGNGGPPVGCQDEYFDGSIDAVGCLSVLPSYGKIPASAQKLICPIAKCGKVVPELLPVLSTRPLRLNGIDIAPSTAFVLDQNDGLMASSKATASLLNTQLPLSTGKLLRRVYSRPLFSANLNQLLAKYPALAAALNLSGFQVSGELTVTLVHYASAIKASVTLPHSFTGSGGAPVTSSVLLTASNQTGLVLDDMLIALPSADFGGTLEFDHLAFCYQLHISERFCEKKTGASFGSFEGTSASSWNATAEINILGTEINAVPTTTDPQQGIGFVNGQFDFAGASVSFNPAIPLGDTGVSMTSLQASLALNPTRFQGAIGLTAGDLVSINGQMFMVFASPSQPYTFTGHEVGATGMPTPTVTTFAVAVGGNVGILLPVVGNTTLASGYVLFYPGYLAAGGNINVNILNGTLVIGGGVNGQFSLDNTTFDVMGNLNVTASVLGVSIGFGAQAVVSSIGIGACGTASLPWPIGNVSAGVGYTWGGSVNTWVGSCDLSPYEVIVTIAPGSTAASPIRLHVPAGLRSEMVQVRGQGGAPEVTITGPGGQHATITGGHEAIGKPFVIFRNTKTDTTYIAILKPKAGTYTITANPGSPRITQVLDAQGESGSVQHRFAVRVPRS